MAEKLWHFLINSFLVATTRSYRAMRKIANFTLNALNVTGNAALLALYTRLLPFVTDFNAKYTVWLNSLGVEESSTNSLYVEFQLLSSTYIRDWDIAIQSVYNINTAIYKAILSKRRRPFQRGSQGDRFSAVQALSLALAGKEGLEDVLTDVNAKLAVINGLINAAATKKSGAKTASSNVEAARVVLGQELYGILGQLMDMFRKTPEMIANFLDLTTIRHLEQTLWRRTVKAAKQVYIFTRTLLPTDQLRLVNLGLADLEFAFVATKNGEITTIFIKVTALSSITVNRSEMGDMDNRFCVVKNLSADVSGKYMVVLI